MIRRICYWLPVMVFLAACGRTGQAREFVSAVGPADRVFLNGAVYTVDPDRSWANAIAVRGGKIVYVGADDEARAFIGDDTSVTDLDGNMLLPGFHDAHIHLLIGLATDDECDLLRLETIEAVAARLEDCSQLTGMGDENWIIGVGWAEWLWPESYPRKQDLDSRFPDRPVFLISSFGHSAWVNSRALDILGIDDDTPDPADGIIERDPETGEAAGMLRDGAMLLAQDKLPGATMEQRLQGARKAIALGHSVGITAIIEPGMDEELLLPVVALADMGELKLRVLVSLSTIAWQPGAFDDGVYDLLEQREQWRRPNLNVNSVKIYMDGIIESGTGAMLEPYIAGNTGLGPRYYSQEQVDEYFTQLDAMGLQVHVHAIGDAGIRMALDGFEAAKSANGEFSNRHQIVHLQLIDEADIPRFGELGIAATFQALWAYPEPSVTELALPLLGEERTNRTYPIGSVHKSGGRIVGGSDYDVTDLNPLHAIEVAITRQDPYADGGPALNKKEAVDLATMIDAYTINGAYMMGLDDKQGSIEVGKRADLIVLDRNLFDIPVYEINEARVLQTIFNGETVFEQPHSGSSRPD